MVARLQMTFAAVLLLGSSGWLVLLCILGMPLLAFSGLVLVVVLYASVLGAEFGLLRGSYRQRGEKGPSIAELARAFWREFHTAPRVFLWSQPFRSKEIRDHLAADETGYRGVVLVHGFFCNRGIWNDWMSRLRIRGIPFVAVTLEPAFGSIDAYATTIDSAVSTLERATGKAPVLVGHSMGGLAIRSWLQQRGSLERAHHVVTIGSPHSGTAIVGKSFAANVRQMRVDSSWLRNLETGELASSTRRFTCFWSRCDNIVFPTGNATMSGADNRQLAAMPHVAMTRDPEILAEIVRLATAS